MYLANVFTTRLCFNSLVLFPWNVLISMLWPILTPAIPYCTIFFLVGGYCMYNFLWCKDGIQHLVAQVCLHKCILMPLPSPWKKKKKEKNQITCVWKKRIFKRKIQIYEFFPSVVCPFLICHDEVHHCLPHFMRFHLAQEKSMYGFYFTLIQKELTYVLLFFFLLRANESPP